MMKNLKLNLSSLTSILFFIQGLNVYAYPSNITKLVDYNIKYSMLKSDDNVIPAPQPDLEGIKQYAKENSGNLPNVYGQFILNSVSLKDDYVSGGFKNFPIQLNCMQKPVCNALLEIGDLGNGLFRIAAYDKNTKKRAELSIKFTLYNGNYISTSNQDFTIEQPEKSEVINTDNYINVSPYFSYNYNSPISFIHLPLFPNSYYQICDRNGEDCSSKKQLFDNEFSGNELDYLSFWKLAQKKYLSPNTSQTIQFSYNAGLTESTSTTFSWSLGLKVPLNSAELSSSISRAINKTVSFQKSKGVIDTVIFDSPPSQATVGEYILYAGVINKFPAVDSLVKDLNEKLQNNSEFSFSKLRDYYDSKSRSYISSGTAVFANKGSDESNNLITWSVSVPSN